MLLDFYVKHKFYRLLSVITLANTLNDKFKYKWNLTFEILIDLRPCPCLLERLIEPNKTLNVLSDENDLI